MRKGNAGIKNSLLAIDRLRCGNHHPLRVENRPDDLLVRQHG